MTTIKREPSTAPLQVTEKEIRQLLDIHENEVLTECKRFDKDLNFLFTAIAEKMNAGYRQITLDLAELIYREANPRTVKDKKELEAERKNIIATKTALGKYFKDPKLNDNIPFTRKEIIDFLFMSVENKLIDMEKILEVGQNDREQLVSFDDIVLSLGDPLVLRMYAYLCDKGIAQQSLDNCTGGNLGPGEFMLMLIASNVEKAKKGDLIYKNREIEVKSGSYSTGTGSSTTPNCGGKFNCEYIVKGNQAANNLRDSFSCHFANKGLKFEELWTQFMAEQYWEPAPGSTTGCQVPSFNKIGAYVFDPKRFNMPTISDNFVDIIYNKFFRWVNATPEDLRTLAIGFAKCTFIYHEMTADGHYGKIVEQLNDEFGFDWFNHTLDQIVTEDGLDPYQLKRLIIAMQFQSYKISMSHDQVLYINKTNRKFTNVFTAKDLLQKLDDGIIVTAKNISLTDKQQTACHHITVGE